MYIFICYTLCCSGVYYVWFRLIWVWLTHSNHLICKEMHMWVCEKFVKDYHSVWWTGWTIHKRKNRELLCLEHWSAVIWQSGDRGGDSLLGEERKKSHGDKFQNYVLTLICAWVVFWYIPRTSYNNDTECFH